ncbi:TPA: hypothetical protein DCX16_04680 [bacterium]|nr:hypothetical protein [bacterium]
MEILGVCMAVMSLCLTAIGITGVYVWKANGKIQVQIMQGLERIEQGIEKIEESQKEIAQMLFNQTKILEKIEGKIPSSTG